MKARGSRQLLPEYDPNWVSILAKLIMRKVIVGAFWGFGSERLGVTDTGRTYVSKAGGEFDGVRRIRDRIQMGRSVETLDV